MYSTGRQQAAQISPPTTGARAFSDLVRSVRTLWCIIRVRGTVTLAGGPATAILNGGSILSALNPVTGLALDENGTRNVELGGMDAQAWSAMFAASTDLGNNIVRLSNLANGAYNLDETIAFPFGNIQSAVPTETAFCERNPARAFQFAAQALNGTSLADVIVTTPGTAVLSNLRVDVLQRYDWERGKGIALDPVVGIIADQQVTGANPNFIIKLDYTNYLQGIIVRQYTDDGGEVDDIINSIALVADGVNFIEQFADFSSLQSDARMNFPSEDATGFGRYPHYFREGGRLSNIVNPNALTNFRIIANVQPSAGGTNSFIRVIGLGLTRVPGLTWDNVSFLK